MRNLNRLRNRYDIAHATVAVECYCLLDAEYDGLDAFTEAGGAIATESPLMVRCPRCSQVYAGDASFAPREGKSMLSLSLEASDGDDRPTIPAGTCPACESEVYAEDYYEGPGHPDIGWNHYECPACEQGISPRRFDVRTPTVSTEGDDR